MRLELISQDSRYKRHAEGSIAYERGQQVPPAPNGRDSCTDRESMQLQAYSSCCCMDLQLQAYSCKLTAASLQQAYSCKLTAASLQLQAYSCKLTAAASLQLLQAYSCCKLTAPLLLQTALRNENTELRRKLQETLAVSLRVRAGAAAA